ncbi:MAG: aminodeoxychorismate/anthranilate synthase component II [Sporomusaceae bacterium]|nr:aminodeoxychorismate/anthranilate synthase component II [Sporomusaceae bacterium]
MIAVIDNYDSFTYNLVQYLGMLNADIAVYRNDAISAAALLALAPTHIVISPGPGTPAQAGISKEVIRRCGPQIPLLGVCLGHQAIGEVFGGKVVRTTPMHGKTSLISHDGRGVYCGLETPFTAARYHSLVVAPETVPDCLTVTARSGDGAVMGLRHRVYPVEGVQFHPESILTAQGMRLIGNFLEQKPIGGIHDVSIPV